MPFRAVVLTISDSRSAGRAEDRSGPAIVERLSLVDSVLVHREVVPDEIEAIQQVVRTWVGRCEMILTTGGTGISDRDVTPEAMRPLVERELPGFGEAMRMKAFEKMPTSIVSRGGAGISGRTLIVWMPGSPKAAGECVGWLAGAIRHVCGVLVGVDVGH